MGSIFLYLKEYLFDLLVFINIAPLPTLFFYCISSAILVLPLVISLDSLIFLIMITYNRIIPYFDFTVVKRKIDNVLKKDNNIIDEDNDSIKYTEKDNYIKSPILNVISDMLIKYQDVWVFFVYIVSFIFFINIFHEIVIWNIPILYISVLLWVNMLIYYIKIKYYLKK